MFLSAFSHIGTPEFRPSALCHSLLLIPCTAYCCVRHISLSFIHAWALLACDSSDRQRIASYRIILLFERYLPSFCWFYSHGCHRRNVLFQVSSPTSSPTPTANPTGKVRIGVLPANIQVRCGSLFVNEMLLHWSFSCIFHETISTRVNIEKCANRLLHFSCAVAKRALWVYFVWFALGEP